MDIIITLFMLILLQAVLGFDNLLYISLESKRAPVEKQKMVRRWGIGIAVVARLVLLFVLFNLVKYFQDPFFSVKADGVISASVSLASIITFLGGVFIMYTAIKEIFHMIGSHSLDGHGGGKASFQSVIAKIVAMNLVFSVDSILSAMALTNVFWVMALAIVISGIMMIWLADRVSVFLEKNRMYEVLGLFVLLIVGVLLISEGAHQAHLELFDHAIHAMSKSTFYFVIAVLVAVDLVQTRYQKRLLAANGKKGVH